MQKPYIRTIIISFALFFFFELPCFCHEAGGDKVWEFFAGGYYSQLKSSPAVSDGYVYFGSSR